MKAAREVEEVSYQSYKDNMGFVARKAVFGVSVKTIFKPVSSATETIWKIKIFTRSKLTYQTFQKANNKSARRRLCCSQSPEDRFSCNEAHIIIREIRAKDN